MDVERSGALEELVDFLHGPIGRPVPDVDVEMLLESACLREE